MEKNSEATRNHLANLTRAHEMLAEISSHVMDALKSTDITDGTCGWSAVSESGRIVADLSDLYNRLTNQGEYK